MTPLCSQRRDEGEGCQIPDLLFHGVSCKVRGKIQAESVRGYVDCSCDSTTLAKYSTDINQRFTLPTREAGYTRTEANCQQRTGRWAIETSGKTTKAPASLPT